MFSAIVLMYTVACCFADEGQGTANYIERFEGAQLGTMGPYNDQPHVEVRVWHLEVDKADREKYLLADGSALKAYHRTTKDTADIAGSNNQDGPAAIRYREGRGTWARFSQITGFTQFNNSYIYVVDKDNNCIRSINRETKETSQLAGSCGGGNWGNADGDLTDARFNLPAQIVTASVSFVIYVTDSINKSIRKLDLFQNRVSTFKQLDQSPRSITIRRDSLKMYVTTRSQLIEITMSDGSTNYIINSDEAGFNDGSLASAQISNPAAILEFKRDVYLLADTDNNRLRIVDIANNRTSSVCTGDGVFSAGIKRIDSCQIKQPTAIMELWLTDRNSQLIIGTRSTTMRRLEYSKRPKKGSRPGNGRPRPTRRHSTDSVTERTTTTEDSSGEDDSTPATHDKAVDKTTIIIISVVVAGVVVIVAIIATVFLFYKRSKHQGRVETHHLDDIMHSRNQADLAKSGTDDYTVYRKNSGEYAEVDDTYHAVDMQRMIDASSIQSTPPAKRANRYGPLPNRPTSNEQQPEDVKYYYATSEMSRGNDSGILSTLDEEARRESLQYDDGYADRAQTEERNDNGSNSNKSMSRLPQPDDYGYIDFNSTEDIKAAVDKNKETD